MKHSSAILSFFAVVLCACPSLSLAQQPGGSIHKTRNFTRTWETSAPEKDDNKLMQRPRKDVKQITTFFDGLGRDQQTVEKQGSMVTASDSKADVVNPVVYDRFGRETEKHLPYVAGTSNGLFKDNFLTEQIRFYSTATGPFAEQGESHFYAKTEFDRSPLNRVVSSMAPGRNWSGANRGVNLVYEASRVLDSVRIWQVRDSAGDFGLYSSAGVYQDGDLYKFTTIDEDGKKVVEYKDKQERVILKKVQASETPGNGHAGWLCTYYIYDDMKRLRAVLQPNAVENLQENGTWHLDSATLSELTFRYEYDAKGRMIIKKVPGAGAVYMVYDARDRLVMTQDANMREPGNEKWLVTIYENHLNRPWRTGLWFNNQLFSDHLNAAEYSTNYPSITSGWELLSETHYDDYTNLPPGLTSSLVDGYAGSLNATPGFPDYAEHVIASPRTKGLVTWSSVKVLNENKYLSTVFIYDDKGRTIQTQSQNYTGGTDILTVQYDFSGKVLRSHLKHQFVSGNTQHFEIATKNNYDDLGRITKVEKNINDAGWKTITISEYDVLGRLKTRKISPDYNNGQGLETLTYDYNVRGWLLGVNRSYLNDKNHPGYNKGLFGFELGYDKAEARASTSFTNARYNGNIAGMVWKSAGDEVRRKYDFTYDAANRFGKADFTQNINASAAGAYSAERANFSVHGLDADNNYQMKYDANGNILSMVQHGIKGSSPDVVIDALRYSYFPNSNKLKQVSDENNDKTSTLGDLKYDQDIKTDTDYGYDKNGNLVTDLNKKLNGATGSGIMTGGAISYNHLNLPVSIEVAGKGNIEYLYDANGNKLKKIVHEAGRPDRSTLYIGGIVYEDGKLQFLPHEEGRIRPLRDINQQVTGYTYDYFIKDHLGNVRMVVTEEQHQDAYPVASLEDAAIENEKLFYRIPDQGGSRMHSNNVPGYPQNDQYTSPNHYVQKLNGNDQKVGTSIVLKVMSGDKVNIRASSWYRQNGMTVNHPQSALTDIVTSLAEGLTGSAISKATSITTNQGALLLSGVAGFLSHQNSQAAPVKPKAYLNWLLLDEQLTPVITNDGTNSGFDQVGEDLEFKIHEILGREITKNGYLYIYLSNESAGTDVFFDNLQVTHIKGPILEETHYYPFGLTMAGISSKAAGGLENRSKFNGGNNLQNGEFSDGSGLETYDAVNRMYDPQLGRFTQVDKLADVLFNYSPYVFGNNDPILYNDPLGLLSTPRNPDVLQEVVVTAKKTNPWNNLSYASTAAWVDKQRAGGFNDNQINTFLDRRNLNNQSRDKFTDAMSRSATRIREAEDEYKDAQAVVAKMIALGLIPIGEIGGLVGMIGSRVINVIAKSGGKVLAESVAKGASEVVSVIPKGDLLRIQNAATRINKPITVVGSRAKGSAGANSDWDYVIEGLNNKLWHKIKNSLPGSKSIMDNTQRNIDIFKGPVNTSLPHITIYPR